MVVYSEGVSTAPSEYSRHDPIPWSKVAHHLWPVFLMGVLMMILYLAGFHQPDPKQVPLAVVGTSARAEQTATAFTDALGEHADVRRMADEAEAREALQHLDISGAVVPQDGGVELLVASAASDTTASVVERMIRMGVEARGGEVTVVDVAPLPVNDPIGQNGFFMLVVMSVSAYSMALGIASAAVSRTMRERVLAGLVMAVVITSIAMAVAVGVLGMFTGHVLEVGAVTLLLCATIMTLGIGLYPILGRYSTLVLATVFVALNFTSSGGIFEPALQPGFFGLLNQFWVGSGYIQAITRLQYFPETSLWGPMLNLLAWTVVALVAVGVGAALDRRRHRREDAEAAELAAREGADEADHGRTEPDWDEEWNRERDGQIV